jgi:hypothetical protein
MNKQLEIALTGRRPVIVSTDKWEIIARYSDHDEQHYTNSNRFYFACVRQHSDGRCIVYATYKTNLSEEYDYAAGEKVDSLDDVPDAIFRVVDQMNWHRRIADQLIADLPPEELDKNETAA